MGHITYSLIGAKRVLLTNVFNRFKGGFRVLRAFRVFRAFRVVRAFRV